MREQKEVTKEKRKRKRRVKGKEKGRDKKMAGQSWQGAGLFRFPQPPS